MTILEHESASIASSQQLWHPEIFDPEIYVYTDDMEPEDSEGVYGVCQDGLVIGEADVYNDPAKLEAIIEYLGRPREWDPNTPFSADDEKRHFLYVLHGVIAKILEQHQDTQKIDVAAVMGHTVLAETIFWAGIPVGWGREFTMSKGDEKPIEDPYEVMRLAIPNNHFTVSYIKLGIAVIDQVREESAQQLPLAA